MTDLYLLFDGRMATDDVHLQSRATVLDTARSLDEAQEKSQDWNDAVWVRYGKGDGKFGKRIARVRTGFWQSWEDRNAEEEMRGSGY